MGGENDKVANVWSSIVDMLAPAKTHSPGKSLLPGPEDRPPQESIDSDPKTPISVKVDAPNAPCGGTP